MEDDDDEEFFEAPPNEFFCSALLAAFLIFSRLLAAAVSTCLYVCSSMSTRPSSAAFFSISSNFCNVTLLIGIIFGLHKTYVKHPFSEKTSPDLGKTSDRTGPVSWAMGGADVGAPVLDDILLAPVRVFCSVKIKWEC